METNTQQAPKTLEQVIEYCKFQRFDTEQVGSWIWVSFDEKPAESTLNASKSTASGIRPGGRNGPTIADTQQGLPAISIRGTNTNTL